MRGEKSAAEDAGRRREAGAPPDGLSGPARAQAYINLGMWHFGHSRHEASAEAFRQALSVPGGLTGPDLAMTYWNWGNQLHFLGRPGEVVEAYELAASVPGGLTGSELKYLRELQNRQRSRSLASAQEHAAAADAMAASVPGGHVDGRSGRDRPDQSKDGAREVTEGHGPVADASPRGVAPASRTATAEPGAPEAVPPARPASAPESWADILALLESKTRRTVTDPTATRHSSATEVSRAGGVPASEGVAPRGQLAAASPSAPSARVPSPQPRSHT